VSDHDLPDTSKIGMWSERGKNYLFDTEQRLRSNNPAISYLLSISDRDSEAHASVLGSAVALRLFLFLIPATVALASLVSLVHIRSYLETQLANNATTGAVVESVSAASGWRSVSLLISGIFLTLWAGRTLGRVLATCTVSAWRMDPKQSKVGPIAVISLTGIFTLNVLASLILNGIGKATGIPGTTVTWVTLGAVTAVLWFMVMATLPRLVKDPAVLIPGAVVMGVGFAAIQVYSHAYLPGKIERTSSTFGSLAGTVAILGSFFFMGRLMSLSFVINAVTYERFGSISQFIFGLPVVRLLPARYKWIRHYFSLDIDPADVSGPEPDAEGGGQVPAGMGLEETLGSTQGPVRSTQQMNEPTDRGDGQRG